MLHDKPVTAKFISVTVATVATYLGNRHWTWRHRERTGLHREYVLFFVLNGIGLLIAAGCLGFSRYVLDLHSALADNIAANVVGLGLGTLFRFWSYRKFVFRKNSPWKTPSTRRRPPTRPAGAGRRQHRRPPRRSLNTGGTAKLCYTAKPRCTAKPGCVAPRSV